MSELSTMFHLPPSPTSIKLTFVKRFRLKYIFLNEGMPALAGTSKVFCSFSWFKHSIKTFK